MQRSEGVSYGVLHTLLTLIIFIAALPSVTSAQIREDLSIGGAGFKGETMLFADLKSNNERNFNLIASVEFLIPYQLWHWNTNSGHFADRKSGPVRRQVEAPVGRDDELIYFLKKLFHAIFAT